MKNMNYSDYLSGPRLTEFYFKYLKAKTDTPKNKEVINFRYNLFSSKYLCDLSFLKTQIEDYPSIVVRETNNYLKSFHKNRSDYNKEFLKYKLKFIESQLETKDDYYILKVDLKKLDEDLLKTYVDTIDMTIDILIENMNINYYFNHF